MYVKQLLCITLFAFAAMKPVMSVSQEQMEKLAKSMRKSCLQKIDTSEDLIDGMRTGNFPDDDNLKCYTNCIMKTLRSFKNGAIDFPMIIRQIEMAMPPKIVARMKEVIAKCSKREYSGDECTITYDYVKCYYEVDPEIFIFP
ncbi:General odorant-binding protein 19a [Habropoda laboriosa]|uniref:General odorant-binding protein 19a n=1 Tax=Habropoda laboriosa TaxID=597456 RepID=A0A0L7QNV4_9HYME|nr:PREDICTED: general odorant-binding protein 83a-like [Habropoda laboriosa]KOC60249.1 General odorant-binding protein 19a [Habropoda laboriosa]